MDPRQELQIREAIEQAQQSGDVRAELRAREQLDALSSSVQDNTGFVNRVTQATHGVNLGLVELPGMAVDAVTGAMNWIPGVNIQNPVGGSAWNRRQMESARMVGNRAWEQNLDPTGKFLVRTGRDVGASVIPAGATLRAAQGTQKLASPLLEGMVAPARTAPGRFAATEAGLSVSSGAGAATAQQIYPDNPMAEMVGGLLGGVVPSLTPAAVRVPFRGAGRQAMQRNIDDFARAGASPSVGQAVGNRRSQALETIISKLPGGGGPFSRAAQRTASNLGKRVDEITARLSRSAEPEVAGRAIERGADDFAFRFRVKSEALYSRLDDFIEPMQAVGVRNTARALGRLTAPIEGAQNLSGILANPKIAKIQQAFAADAAQGTLPYRALKELRSEVGRMLSTSELHTQMPKAQVKQLYAALSKDLKAAAQDAGDDALGAFNRANKYYRAGVERMDDHLQPLLKRANPEDIFTAATRGKEGATRIRAVKRSLKPDQWNTVVSATLKRMGQATARNQNELSDVFSPETFLTNWNRLSKPAKAELFSGSARLRQYKADIEAVAKAAARIREGSRVLQNPSGTAGQGANIGAASIAGYSVLTGDFGTPLVIGLGAVSSNAASRLMTNPKFVRWLAQGTEISPARLPGYVARLGEALRNENPEIQAAAREYLNQFREVKK